jgi:hypothetical protein
MDTTSLSLLLMNMPYIELINYCSSHTDANRICEDETFWMMKMLHDFERSVDQRSLLSARQQYFKLYDRITFEGVFDTKLVIRRLLDYIRFTESNSKEISRIHFSGEGDRIQTNFEKLSNELRVGVIAKNKKSALCLLSLTRINIDDNEDLIPSTITWMEEENIDITYTNLLTQLVEAEDVYYSSFKLGEPISIRLSDGTVTARNISDIDIWTLPRLENIFRK